MTKISKHIFLASIAVLFWLAGIASAQHRYLILNFDCRGEAAGESEMIGSELRKEVLRQGGKLADRKIVNREIKKGGYSESDLNYMLDELRSLLPKVKADCAAFGQIYTTEDLFIIELKYLENRSDPILFDPIICGSKTDIYSVLPDIARMIVSPDKIPPYVVSVNPTDDDDKVGVLTELQIVFSEPMNPSTISISARPEKLWERYGNIRYDDKSNSFYINVHLYPDIEYQFSINGEDSRGFKDLAGNPANNFTWSFKTAR